MIYHAMPYRNPRNLTHHPSIIHTSPPIPSPTTCQLLCGMGLANISFDASLATALCCDMGTDALLSVFRLNSDQVHPYPSLNPYPYLNH